MIVLPSRSPPATFWPRVIRCSSTLSTVSSLNSHLLTAVGLDRGRARRRPRPTRARPTAPSPLRTGRRSVMPSRWNLSGTETALGGTRNPSLDRLVEVVGVGRARRSPGRTGRRCCGRSRPSASPSGRPAASRSSRRSRRYFWIDRAVRLVDDDQVEVADAEPALAVRLASRRSAPSSSGRSRRRRGPRRLVSVTRFTGDASGRCFLKAFDRLVHQRDAVGEEQHALDPVARASAGRPARSPCASCRRRSPSPAAPCARCPARTPRRCGGWRASGSSARRSLSLISAAASGLRRGAALDQQLQLVLLVEALHRPRRIARVVPEPVLVAVGVEDHRPLAELLFQAVGVELGLLLADARVALVRLASTSAERLAVVAPQHVVDEALARSCWACR